MIMLMKVGDLMSTVPFVFGLTLTIICFLFFIFLVVVYFRKDARYNLKNRIFRRIILFGFSGYAFEFLYFFMNHYSKVTLLLSLTRKFILLSFIGALLLWIYYTFIIVFERHKEASNYIRKNRGSIDIYLLITFIAISIISLLLPVHFSFNELELVEYMDGPAIYFLYIVSIIISLLPVPFIILYKEINTTRRLFTYYFNLGITIVSCVFGVLFPSYCFISLPFTLGCCMIYYRLENPDILFVRKFKKNSDRMREIREKYGFLFNMSPELRDLLNEISFMKENYIFDQKKTISKKKLESLLTDFIKSSEEGTTKQTLVDDDGIEILDLEEDVPDEMLITKEIYSLDELQEVLKEDNLPKW